MAAQRDAVGPHGRGDEQDGERDLDIVVIDAPGNEVLERRQAEGSKEERERGGGAPGKPPGDGGGTRHRRKEPQHRPDRAGETFGKIAAGEWPNIRIRPAMPASISRDQWVS